MSRVQVRLAQKNLRIEVSDLLRSIVILLQRIHQWLIKNSCEERVIRNWNSIFLLLGGKPARKKKEEKSPNPNMVSVRCLYRQKMAK